MMRTILAALLAGALARVAGAQTLERAQAAAARLVGGGGRDGIPLEEFERLSPARIFLLKHRFGRPPRFRKASTADIVANRYPVGVGLEVEGVVTRARPWYRHFDGDYSFEIGAERLHLEITPEWYTLNPRMRLPRVGDYVRARGWSYYDTFHLDPNEAHQQTMWEIHPVTDVVILRRAPRRAGR